MKIHNSLNGLRLKHQSRLDGHQTNHIKEGFILSELACLYSLLPRRQPINWFRSMLIRPFEFFCFFYA